MTTKITRYEFGSDPDFALSGWDPDAIGAEGYDTPRARALYKALGANPSDEEYSLAKHLDGRWGLFGMSVEGHSFATEDRPPLSRNDVVTTATLMQVGYTSQHAQIIPESVWRLDDGRVLVAYFAEEDRRHVFASTAAFGEVHPHYATQDQGSPSIAIFVAPIPVTYTVSLDWAAVHHAAAEVDRARQGTSIGRGIVDAFGGSYSYTAYSSLADLVRLTHGLSQIAADTWAVIHEARKGTWVVVHKDRKNEDGVDRARQACRVAIACSRLFALLHGAGLIDDPSSRICGTGPGYGLQGLLWLAGADSDTGCTSEEVERFAAGGPLPTR
jgi:hypothetical protein